MKNEKRIEKATRKTIDLFNKKRNLIEQAELSIEIESYGSLRKEGKKLRKIDRQYNRAFEKLTKLQEKNNINKIGIAEGVEA